jgi:hypothetical protein
MWKFTSMKKSRNTITITIRNSFGINRRVELPEELRGIWRADGLALVENGREAGEERGVANVGVTHDPAQVRRPPPHLTSAHPKNRLDRPGQDDGMTSS